MHYTKSIMNRSKKSKLQRKKNCRFNSHHSNQETQFGHYEIYISNHHLKLMEFVQKELVALLCKIIVLFHNFVGTICCFYEDLPLLNVNVKKVKRAICIR